MLCTMLGSGDLMPGLSPKAGWLLSSVLTISNQRDFAYAILQALALGRRQKKILKVPFSHSQGRFHCTCTITPSFRTQENQREAKKTTKPQPPPPNTPAPTAPIQLKQACSPAPPTAPLPCTPTLLHWYCSVVLRAVKGPSVSLHPNPFDLVTW